MTENENILPFRKPDQFGLFIARIERTGEVIEKEQVGIAEIKPGSRGFWLKLWMFAHERYLLVSSEADASLYEILAVEADSSVENPSGSRKRIGVGALTGSFIRLKFHLLDEEIFLCLFPQKSEVIHVA